MKQWIWTLYAAWLLVACSNEELSLVEPEPLLPELPTIEQKEELPMVDDVCSPEVMDDSHFARYCLARFDTNGDGMLSMTEAERVERIVRDEDPEEQHEDHGWFASMKGIEYFKNLEVLEVRSTVLKELDLSYNTHLEELRFVLPQNLSRLTVLDVSNTRLTELVVPISEIYKLDVRGSRLHSLNVCSTDGHLTELDVRYCDQLEELRISNSPIEAVDLRYCSKLTSFSASHTNLQAIDLSQNKKLENLELIACGITSIDLHENTALEVVDLQENSLNSIDLSDLKALIWLNLSGNPITELDITDNESLKSLTISDTAISSLNTDNNTDLRALICNNAKLTRLDLSTNGKIEQLLCSGNMLTELNITPKAGENLKQLQCSNNLFTSLDLSNTTLRSWNDDTQESTTESCNFAPQPNLEVLSLATTTEQVSLTQFSGCPKLRKVILYATEAPELLFEKKEKCAATLYVPAEAVDSYLDSDWGDLFDEVRSL